MEKLVRDKIPDLKKKDGEQVQMRIARKEEIFTLLKAKLLEEAQELVDAIEPEREIEELADVWEVLDELLSNAPATRIDVKRARIRKSIKKGRFEKKIVMQF